MKKLLATGAIALMTLAPVAAHATTPEAVHCVTSDGIPAPCTTSPVPLPPVEQKTKTKPPVEGTASEAAAIIILSFLFGAAVITLGWCSGRFGNN